jgi:hypothetical protein
MTANRGYPLREKMLHGKETAGRKKNTTTKSVSKMTIRVKFLITICFLMAGIQVFGQDPIPVNRLTDDPVFDGMPDESLKMNGTRVALVMHAPDSGESPNEESEVYIAYTSDFLWICADLYYSDPGLIVSTSRKRDEESVNTDLFGVILDTYNDNENALAFFTTPAGQRIDYTVSNDAQRGAGSGSPLNYSWNTFWDVKTIRHDRGWSVEIRIPFSSLRFQVIRDKVQMGIIINRTIRHCYETDTYPAIDRKYGSNAAMKPSLAAKIQFEEIKETRPVYISPYVITGLEGGYELNADATAYEKTAGERPSNAGLDAKFSLTSNLTMDLSVNTDFAQVEADDQTVNLTRYSLFFPEKRMFFQERAAIFNFGLYGSDNLFYSRTIGMDETGIPVPILGGVRFTGRAGKWDLGLMDMQTMKKNEVPAENFSLFRLRKQVINSNSYIGAMLTSRLGPEDNYFSYGIDGIFRVIADNYLKVSLAQTVDSTGNSLPSFKNPAYFMINWQNRNTRGFSYNATYHSVARSFNPRMGFLTQSGIKGGDAELRYGWIPGPESKLFSYNITFSFSQKNRTDDKSIESRIFGPGFSLQTKSGWFWLLNANFITQGITGSFPIGTSVVIPVGRYNYLNSSMMFNTPMYKPVAIVINASGGEFYDGKNFSVSLQPVCNLSESVQVTGSYNYTRVVIPGRDQEMNAHIGRIRILYMYNTKLSVSSFIQYNSLYNTAMANFRLRYNHREGTDLYLVYNETVPTPGFFNDGLMPVSYLNRLFQAKFIYTFQL